MCKSNYVNTNNELMSFLNGVHFSKCALNAAGLQFNIITDIDESLRLNTWCNFTTGYRDARTIVYLIDCGITPKKVPLTPCSEA